MSFRSAAAGQESAKPKTQPKKVPTESTEGEGTVTDEADTQPPTEPPPVQTLRERARQLASSRSPILRLASTPNMFGDYFNQPMQFGVNGVFSSNIDIATSGMLGRSLVSENNKAVTMHRFYHSYSYFNNALQGDVDTLDAVAAADLSFDRQTIGFERRMLDDLWSVDLRLPLLRRYEYGIPKVGTTGAEIGNLSIILKRQLLATCTTGVVAGLSIETPTGGDTRLHAGGTNFRLYNDTVHLSPYAGMMYVPDDCFFYHSFLQVDVPLNGNRLSYNDPFRRLQSDIGRLNEQTLLHWDVSAGAWLYSNPCAPILTGLASVVEFHYTTALQDADILRESLGPLGFQFGNTLNRYDTVQCTVGLHMRLGERTTLRAAACSR